MELHQVRYFLAVSETLNFTRAAEQCHVAQPSLSRAIQKLEDELGGPLFRRERGRTHMTELGRSMLPFLTQCHTSALAAKAQATALGSTERAPLRLGVAASIDLGMIAPFLTELARVWPGLELNLRRGTTDEILAVLEAGEIEIAVAPETGAQWERLDRAALYTDGFVLVTPPDHALARRNRVSLADLAGQRIVTRPYCEFHQALEHALASSGVRLENRDALADDADVAALVESGFGAAIMPATARRGPAARAVLISDLELSRSLEAYTVAGRRQSIVSSGLLRLLRAADWTDVADRV
ncbi:MAG: LysR family transcriptional regulator [Proteobacteria bacterium]|nr:LysR family transcriptional regulator [Pseudomonadota bacterium]